MFLHFSLHDVVERRSLELKKSADKIFEETIFKIHLNEQMIQKTRYGVQYDKELVKTVQKRNKRAELMKLSEYVSIKLYVKLTNMYFIESIYF